VIGDATSENAHSRDGNSNEDLCDALHRTWGLRWGIVVSQSHQIEVVVGRIVVAEVCQYVLTSCGAKQEPSSQNPLLIPAELHRLRTILIHHIKHQFTDASLVVTTPTQARNLVSTTIPSYLV
jgi:hypothetical protein